MMASEEDSPLEDFMKLSTSSGPGGEYLFESLTSKKKSQGLIDSPYYGDRVEAICLFWMFVGTELV
jgi:hypothetical protein